MRYGFTKGDFDGSNWTAMHPRAWEDGSPWRNPTAISGKVGRGGGRSDAYAGMSLGQRMSVANRQTVSQFLARGTSRVSAGGRSYQGFRPGATSSRSTIGQQLARGNQQLTRQFLARGTSTALTGTKSYNGFRPGTTALRSSAGAQLARGNQQLSKQFIARGVSDHLTGTKAYNGYQTRPAKAAAAKAQPQAGPQGGKGARTPQAAKQKQSNTGKGSAGLKHDAARASKILHRKVRELDRWFHESNDVEGLKARAAKLADQYQKHTDKLMAEYGDGSAAEAVRKDRAVTVKKFARHLEAVLTDREEKLRQARTKPRAAHSVAARRSIGYTPLKSQRQPSTVAALARMQFARLHVRDAERELRRTGALSL